MTRDRYKIYEGENPHFITCTVVGWLPIFSRPKAAQIVLESFSYLQGNGEIALYAYVIMENHIHLIASGENLSNTIARFKSFTARQIVDYLEMNGEIGLLAQIKKHKLSHKTDREYQLWQEGCHPEMIRDDAMMRQKIEYIHYNPIRRGYVNDAVHWRYSSARDYAGEKGLLDIKTDWL